MPSRDRVRVLVVDDMVVFRTAVSQVLGAHPELEVVGTAPDGALALERIERLRPDVVTLDVEMPVMDGLATLVEIRRRWPDLPVVMFSSLTEAGGRATLDALAAGASDFATKPAKVVDRAAARASIEEGLLGPVLHFGALHRAARLATRPVATAAGLPIARERVAEGRIDAVVIAVSTGGPNALQVLLPALPADLPVPVLVVQHMPPVFTAALAERLDAAASLPVVEAGDGMIAAPGTVFLAPGGRHLVCRRQLGRVVLRTQDGPPENSCRPAADVTLRSAAAAWGEHVLAVVLTGMGQDGTSGAAVVRSADGQVWVQDEPSSVVWGMPGSVVRAGLADRVLPLDRLAAALVEAVVRTPAGARR